MNSFGQLGTTGRDVELEQLRRCLGLGDAVAGAISPNPPVGAVVLDASGVAVGAGATQPVGGPHAEVVALEHAGGAARGGTLISSLEPCAHHGRTGPCTEAIRAAGISRVLFGATDPDPIAAGGAEILEASGIEVLGSQLLDDVRRSALGRWLTAVELGRPHVTWKYAVTLDGRVAAADGSSRWITAEPARADVHRLRAEVDAVLVGSGTVLADDPQLSVRDEAGDLLERQSMRVVFDRRGRIPADARVRDGSGPSLVLSDPLPEALSALYEHGVRAALLEGGPTLAAAFLRAGAVDRIVGYHAPALLGAGPTLVGDLGISGVAGALRLVVEDVRVIGADVRITAAMPTAHSGTEHAVSNEE